MLPFAFWAILLILLMLICFYQKLHEKGIMMEIEDELDTIEELIIEDENNE